MSSNLVKPLTSKQNTFVPFVLCFKYMLDKDYNFRDMEKRNINAFQNFLDKVSKMNLDQVIREMKRKNDKNDTFQGKPVEHFAVNDKFRIHVVREGDLYMVIRIDPEHKVHNK